MFKVNNKDARATPLTLNMQWPAGLLENTTFECEQSIFDEPPYCVDFQQVLDFLTKYLLLD